jgi:hypothetical protein
VSRLAVAWTGRDALHLRTALRLTSEAFAERLRIAPRTVAYWAAHPGTVPRSGVQQGLDQMLEHTTPQARARFYDLTGRAHLRVTPAELAEVCALLDDFADRLSRVERIVDADQISARAQQVGELSRAVEDLVDVRHLTKAEGQPV